jgi:hypothetical protein
VEFGLNENGLKWRDDDYVFSALTELSKNALKDNGDATGCVKVIVGWGKTIGEKVFITLLNCIFSSFTIVFGVVTAKDRKHRFLPARLVSPPPVLRALRHLPQQTLLRYTSY